MAGDQKGEVPGESTSPANIEDWGRVVISSRCYGCGTCRVLAPEIFLEAKAKSASPFVGGRFTELGKRIESRQEFDAVRRGIFSCPVKAISWAQVPKLGRTKLPPVYAGFPELIEDDVYYMGHSDETTFGCAGFFIHRGAGHNIVIDPPIAHPALLEFVREKGGVQHLLFTHKDHSANQQAWYDATKAPRLMHRADVVHKENKYSPFPVTKDFETLLDLKQLQTGAVAGLPELKIIATPGHTPGCLMFLYKDKFLFTGDSLAFSGSRGHLFAHRIQCWQDWGTQLKSLSGLQGFAFQWVLAGHGNWKRFEGPEAAQQDLERCLTWMKQQRPGHTSLLWFILWTKVRPKYPGIKQLLCDSLLMPQAAKDQFPTWTLPTGWLTVPLLLPIAMFGIVQLRARWQ